MNACVQWIKNADHLNGFLDNSHKYPLSLSPFLLSSLSSSIAASKFTHPHRVQIRPSINIHKCVSEFHWIFKQCSNGELCETKRTMRKFNNEIYSMKLCAYTSHAEWPSAGKCTCGWSFARAPTWCLQKKLTNSDFKIRRIRDDGTRWRDRGYTL